MALHSIQYRHVESHVHPSLIESWCPVCGLFIAASEDVRKLETVEDSHYRQYHELKEAGQSHS